MKNLTQMCLLADLTLMLAWNAEEAGKIVETYKLFESKPPDLIMARAQQHPHQKVCTTNTKTEVEMNSFNRVLNLVSHKLADNSLD